MCPANDNFETFYGGAGGANRAYAKGVVLSKKRVSAFEVFFFFLFFPKIPS